MNHPQRHHARGEAASVRLTIDMSPALAGALDRLAHEQGRTKADVLRRSVALLDFAHEARKRGMHFGVTEAPDGLKKEVIGL